jgi:hypothetical protein
VSAGAPVADEPSKRRRKQSIAAYNSPESFPKPLLPYNEQTNKQRTLQVVAARQALLFKEFGITAEGTELLKADMQKISPFLHSAANDDALRRVGNNAAELLKGLPPNSPYRIPLLALLMPGLSNKEIHETLDVSRSSVNRAAEHIGKGNNVFLNTKQTQGITRVQFFLSIPCCLLC